MPALTAGEIADVIRDQVWTVSDVPDVFPWIVLVDLRTTVRGSPVAYQKLIDMNHVKRFAYPLPALYDMILSMQDAVVRLAREVR